MASSKQECRSKHKKLCVICSCAHLGSSYDDDFNIFIIACSGGEDLDLDGVKKIEPNIRVRGFGGSVCFCYLNTESTLYVFEDEQRWVYRYEVSESDAAKSNYMLEKSAVENSTTPAMKTQKYEPRAIPTPDGKMLVFSTKILFHGNTEDLIPNPTKILGGDGCDCRFCRVAKDGGFVYKDMYNDFLGHMTHSHFELFDPRSRRWEEVPQLMISCASNQHFVVKNASDSWIELPLKGYRSWIGELGGYSYPMDAPFAVNACSFIDSSTLLVHVTLQPGLGQFLTLDIGGAEEAGSRTKAGFWRP